MSSEIQCTALNNAIKAKGCRFPPKLGIVIDLVTMFLRVFPSPDRAEYRVH